MSGALARQNAVRSPKRTATTASALMIGVALVGFTTILASSAKASVADTIGRSFTGDVVVEGGAMMGGGGIDPSIAAELRRRPEVGGVVAVRRGEAVVDGRPIELLSGDPGAVGRVFDLGTVRGDLTRLGPDRIAVSSAEATRRRIGLGSPMDLSFAAVGPRRLTVGAIYADDELVGDWLVDDAAYEALFSERLDAKVFLTRAPGTSVRALVHAVEAVTASHPEVDVEDRESFTAAQTEGIDQALALVYGLLALAVVIAVMGIANTLALSIVERTRDLGLLRAVGMTRTQLASTVRWEAVLVAVLGATLGLAVGVGFARAVVAALADQGITTFVIPTGSLVVLTLLAALAGVVASALPARRAARMDVLHAVSAA
jgi:putative ABC transport system permease protein